MKNGKVSLIMPVYNAGQYVQSAIESILNQTYDNIELILIDDVSTDFTMQQVKRYRDDRIQVIHNKKNMGIAYSRNRGLDTATGDYIAIMDDDDISSLDRFDEQVSYLEEHPDIDVVGGKYQLIDEEDTVFYESSKAYCNPLYIKALFLFQNIYSNGEMMFRRRIIDKYGIRYSENQYGMEDFKFWIECSKVVRFTTIDKVFLQHRIHEQSETSRNKTIRLSERELHRMKLQAYSMELSNIFLTQDELMTVNRYTGNKKCQSKEEFIKYYNALRKVVSQAKNRQADFYEELDILCRKYIAYQIRYVNDIWSIGEEIK